MRTRFGVITALTFTTVLTLGLVWTVRASASREKTMQTQNSQFQSPFAEIEEKAMIPSADDAAVRALADAVFSRFTTIRAPAMYMSPFKDMVIRAEINYRTGERSGIPEANLVQVINNVADKLEAPEYAQTNQEEVRKIRMAMSYQMPHFILHQPGESSVEGRLFHFSISPNMSPVEAVFIGDILAEQKKVNMDFQLTPTERAQQPVKPIAPQLGPGEHRLVVGTQSPRSQEMLAVVARFAKMKFQDQLDLANESIKTLGLEP